MIIYTWINISPINEPNFSENMIVINCIGNYA